MCVLNKIKDLYHYDVTRCDETLMIGESYHDDIIKFAKNGYINAALSYYLMINFMNGDIPELLDIIKQDPQYAYYYKRDILKDRFVDAKYIMTYGLDTFLFDSIYEY